MTASTDHRTTSHGTDSTRRRVVVVLGLAVLLLTALPTSADWLMTRDGQRIDTQGPWRLKGTAVQFVQTDGRIDQLPLSYIDLEASQRSSGEEPRIVMYATSWCPYCRKARKLLNALDVEWLEKDVEADPEAARELVAKVGPGAGVPLIDCDGDLVRGYNPDKIRRLVARMQQRERQVAK